MSQKVALLACVLGSACVVSAANASLIQLKVAGKFTGPGTSVTGTLFPGFDSSATYDATIVYDTTVASSPGDGGRVNYDTAMQSLSVTFHTASGNTTVTSDVLTGILPAIPGYPPFFTFRTGMDVLAQTVGDPQSGDIIEVASKSTAGANAQPLYFYLDLFSGQGNHPLNQNSNLPLSLNASEWINRGFFQMTLDASDSANASITSLSTSVIPAPVTLLPLASVLTLVRRRRA